MLGISRDLVYSTAECAHICNDCISKCLREENVDMMVDCIEMCRECSAICINTINLVYENSHFKAPQLELCIEACKACAEECGKHDTDHTQRCAEACRKCEKACRRFLEEQVR